jgi:glucose-1-phosphate adenylyltransferase
MGIYIFTYKELRKYLIEDAAKEDSKHDFGMNIIPTMLNDGKKLYAYEFAGYWKDVGTVESLWQANMDLINDTELDLYNIKKDWKIYTEDTLSKPQIIGDEATIKSSLVTQGCIVNGYVEGSVLFDNVSIGEGAKVIDSVLMPGVLVEEGAEVYKAIVDEGVVIKAKDVVNKEAEKVVLVSNNG